MKVTLLKVCVSQDKVSALVFFALKRDYHLLDKLKDVINGVSNHLWSVYDHIILTDSITEWMF